VSNHCRRVLLIQQALAWTLAPEPLLRGCGPLRTVYLLARRSRVDVEAQLTSKQAQAHQRKTLCEKLPTLKASKLLKRILGWTRPPTPHPPTRANCAHCKCAALAPASNCVQAISFSFDGQPFNATIQPPFERVLRARSLQPTRPFPSCLKPNLARNSCNTLAAVV
jgi:hypothetical protein